MILLAFAFILISSPVFAAESLVVANVTIATPGASGIMGGAEASFNVSLAAGFDTMNYSLAQIYFSSSSLTSNTTEFLAVANLVNTTNVDFNGTIDSIAFEDGNDYIFKIDLWNGTDGLNVTRTGIIVDNTIPQVPTISSITNTSSNRPFISSTLSGVNTTACTLNFEGANPGSPNYVMTHAGNLCTYTFTSDVAESLFRYSVQATDGTNSTNSSVSTLQVDTKTSNFVSSDTIAEAEGRLSQDNILGIVFIIAIIGGAIWIIKKK